MMFQYAVRFEGDPKSFVAWLVDWPEVKVMDASEPAGALRGQLLKAISECRLTGQRIPVPKTRPSTSLCIELTAAESLKVLVLNEVHSSGVSTSYIAGNAGLHESVIIRALDLNLSTDVDLLSDVLWVLGKRLLAYTVSL